MYKCSKCDKVFKTKQSLGGHGRSHSEKKWFKKKKKERSKIKPRTKCNYCNKEFDKYQSLGAHVVLCVGNPNRNITIERIRQGNTGNTLSVSHRKNISEGMKIAHSENRAWNIGKSRWNNKQSYPEQFFNKVIENEFENKEYETEYPVGIYSIDFAWPNKKLAIEIDGEQHKRFKEVIERDKRKDSLLKSKGWKVLRIDWKEMCGNTKKHIEIANQFIHKDW